MSRRRNGCECAVRHRFDCLVKRQHTGRLSRLLVPLTAALLLLFALASLGVLPAVLADRLGIIAAYFGPFDVRQADVTSENWAIVERMARR